jgi:hypothetical protein
LFDDLTGTPGYYGNFSLRKLNPDYTGDCIEIRRASDNTTTNIGFVNDVVDEAAINSFCSGTTGYVRTWYDQSGFGYDFEQTTNIHQPYIYQSGSIETLDGFPCIYFNKDVDQYLLSPNSWAYDISEFSYNHVGAVDNFAGSNAGVFGPYNTFLTGFEYLLHNVISVPTLLRLNGTAQNNDTTDFFFDNVNTISEIYLTGFDTINAYRDGSGLSLDDDFFGGSTLDYDGRYRMSGYGGGASTSRMLEWNFFDANIHAQRTNLYNNQNAYYF